MRGSLHVWRALQAARRLNLGARGARPPGASAFAPTRRRLLQALAATAVPIPALARPSSSASGRIAIIGGGLGGLAALLRLRDAGMAATLYEARAATGGRTRSVSDVFAPGFAFDEGGQLVNSDHKDMRRLIARFGLMLVDRRSGIPEREIQIGRDGAIVPEAVLAEALRPIAAQITADADRLDKDYAGVAREIDPLSVSAYLNRNGLVPGEARDAIEMGIRTEYGAEPHESSALQLLFNLPTVDGVRLDRLPNSDERFSVAGGTAAVARAITKRLAGQIVTGAKLRAVAREGATYRLSFDGTPSVVADHVIVAVPAGLLRSIDFGDCLTPDWQALASEISLGVNEKLVVGYDSQPWRQVFGSGGAIWSATGFSEAWDARSGPPREGPGALGFLLGGAQAEAEANQTAQALASRFTAMARAAIPDLPAPNGKLRRTAWWRDPLSRGAYVNFRPGQLTRFGALMTTEEAGKASASRSGNILFAGEWVSDEWPGYMNGAVQTGRIAADAVIADLRQSRTSRPSSIRR